MFHLIAERKIAEALARGELANLPGEGRPLALEDDALVPEELRAAYRIRALLRTRLEHRYCDKAVAKLSR